ncbi:hypothetical protein Ddye_012398 [Dipteronia dyeriana]|uniref:Uncharacterized protein n=1 Tax=Dipteronia dyeriana TaxID=168575 RepID=A0AAE0CIL8_9ROSI|nr:hypothetical protein Ddye_012398 [Dipteronia dyeriana]
MLPNSYMATLHHQTAYRLQDHALDLLIPGHTRDTIFITAEWGDEIPTIIQIPKQLPKEKLKEVMLLEWITNYEKAFHNTTPSDSDTVTDLTQVYMASRTDPQPSTQTLDSPNDASTSPPHIVEEPHENYTHAQPHSSKPTNGS